MCCRPAQPEPAITKDEAARVAHLARDTRLKQRQRDHARATGSVVRHRPHGGSALHPDGAGIEPLGRDGMPLLRHPDLLAAERGVGHGIEPQDQIPRLEMRTVWKRLRCRTCAGSRIHGASAHCTTHRRRARQRPALRVALPASGGLAAPAAFWGGRAGAGTAGAGTTGLTAMAC